jgi:hypothetical protein
VRRPVSAGLVSQGLGLFDYEDTLKDLGAIDGDAPNPHTELQQDLHSAGDKTSSRLEACASMLRGKRHDAWEMIGENIP